MSTPDYREVNRQSWNDRVDTHVASDFYDMPGFLDGKTSLNDIELPLLGDLTGLSVLHLQCHFGQDTLSMARMGAQATGMDLSDKAIDKARELAAQLELNANFVCCDVYDLPNHLEGQFDLVFTSYGTIGWLPDLDRWAGVIDHFLKPGGRFLIVEFHPVVWMFDDDFKHIQYSYFNDETIIETGESTYTNPDKKMELKEISWNHPLSEVTASLLGRGLKLTDFREYNYSPYECFRHLEKVGDRRFRLKGIGEKMPMVYALMAQKPESHGN